MRISGLVGGRDSIHSKFEMSAQIAEAELMKRVTSATIQIHANALKSLKNTGSGKEATRYRPKRKVKVSLPGQSPNTDRGTAARSIFFFVDLAKKVGVVGTNLKYLAALEFDSRVNNRKARPWLGPALDKFMKKNGIGFFKFKWPREKLR